MNSLAGDSRSAAETSESQSYSESEDAPYATGESGGGEGSAWDDFGRFRRASGITGERMIADCWRSKRGTGSNVARASDL